MGRFLVVLLAVVALAGTAFVVNTQRTGTVNFAKDNAVPKLNLQLTPTLASDLGKVNLHLEWTAYSGADHYQVTVVKPVSTPGTNPGTNNVYYSNKNVTDTSLDVTSLKVGNGDYEVTVKAMSGKDRKGGDRATFGYFEDGFSSITSNADPWSLFKGKFGKINVTRGVLNIQTANPKETDYTSVQTGSRELGKSASLARAFDCSISLISQSSSLTPGNWVGFEIWNHAGRHLGVGVKDSTSSLISYSTPKASGRGVPDLTIYKTVQDPVFPGLLEFKSDDGTNVNILYNGQLLNDSALPLANGIEGLDFFVESLGPQLPTVSASFDNFRLVWAK